jgi:hypothetical protein
MLPVPELFLRRVAAGCGGVLLLDVHVMTDGTTGCGSQNAVVTGNVTSDAADRRTRQASGSLCALERYRGHQHR